MGGGPWTLVNLQIFIKHGFGYQLNERQLLKVLSMGKGIWTILRTQWIISLSGTAVFVFLGNSRSTIQALT
jgi:hypothetical protein